MLTFDTWPLLNTFLEIEAMDKIIVKNTIKLLGLEYRNAIFGSVNEVYNIEKGWNDSYMNKLKKITFNEVK